MIKNFFLNRAVHEIMWQYMLARVRPQVVMRRMRTTRFIPKATDTHSKYLFSTTTILALTRLGITLYVHCLLRSVKQNKNIKCPEHSKTYFFNLVTIKDVKLNVLTSFLFHVVLPSDFFLLYLLACSITLHLVILHAIYIEFTVVILH
jgi:hypothetical protein